MPGNHTFSQSGWWQQAPFLALFSHLFRWFFSGLRVSSHTFPDQYFAEYSRGTLCTSLGFSLSSPALCLEKSPHLSFPRLSYVSSTQELPGIHLGLPMCTAAWKLFLGSNGVTSGLTSFFSCFGGIIVLHYPPSVQSLAWLFWLFQAGK